MGILGILNAYRKRDLFRNTGALCPVPAFTDRNSIADALSAADASGAGATYRARFKPVCPGNLVRLVYGNWYITTAGETDGPNNLAVKAAVEFNGPSNKIHPVYFQGRRTVTIEPGGMVVSDPVGLDGMLNGQHVWVRTYVNGGSNGQWPVGLIGSSSIGDGYAAGVDYADANTIPAVIVAMFQPLLLGAVTSPRNAPNVALVGDSITWGTGDSGLSWAYDGQGGWAKRALGGATPVVAHVNVARGGDTATVWVKQELARRRRLLISGCSHAVVLYGRNDLSTGRTEAQIRSDLTSVWRNLTAMGMRVWGCTILPETTSTDAWATTANQTVKSYEAIRLAVNDWIRASGYSLGLAGVIETADAVESARGSGRWKPSHTSDGVHPNATGHAAMAAVVPLSQFLLP